MKGETFQPARGEHQHALYLSVHPQLSSSPGEEVEEHFPATTPRTIKAAGRCWLLAVRVPGRSSPYKHH